MRRQFKHHKQYRIPPSSTLIVSEGSLEALETLNGLLVVKEVSTHSLQAVQGSPVVVYKTLVHALIYSITIVLYNL